MIAFCFPLIFFWEPNTCSKIGDKCTLWTVLGRGICWAWQSVQGSVRILSLPRDLFSHCACYTWWIIQSVIYTLISLGNLHNFAIIIWYIHHALISFIMPMWYIAHFQVVIVQFVLFVCSIHVWGDTFWIISVAWADRLCRSINSNQNWNGIEAVHEF